MQSCITKANSIQDLEQILQQVADLCHDNMVMLTALCLTQVIIGMLAMMNHMGRVQPLPVDLPSVSVRFPRLPAPMTLPSPAAPFSAWGPCLGVASGAFSAALSLGLLGGLLEDDSGPSSSDASPASLFCSSCCSTCRATTAGVGITKGKQHIKISLTILLLREEEEEGSVSLHAGARICVTVTCLWQFLDCFYWAATAVVELAKATGGSQPVTSRCCFVHSTVWGSQERVKDLFSWQARELQGLLSARAHESKQHFP